MSQPESKVPIMGDDAISGPREDFFGFDSQATLLCQELLEVSRNSSACYAIVGPWGSGKSSFMRIMDGYLRSNSKVKTVWFNAWDPGGMKNLSDSLLYRFYAHLSEEKGAPKELQKEKVRLEQMLGLRRSLTTSAKSVIQAASETGMVPDTVAKGANAAISLGQLLDTPRIVQNSFDALFGYLEKEGSQVFLFVDELDRVDGEQIATILAALKVYLSHRGIGIVLGFDDTYVTQAIRPYLPQEIDPIRYLEKIITVRKRVPAPSYSSLQEFTSRLAQSTFPNLTQSEYSLITNMVNSLSQGNPRYIKRLMLSLAAHFTFQAGEPRHEIGSKVILSTLAEEGLLFRDEVLKSILNDNPSQALAEAKKYEIKLDTRFRLDVMTEMLEEFSVDVEVKRNLMLAHFYFVPALETEEPEQAQFLDWRSYGEAILEKSLEHGTRIGGRLLANKSEFEFEPIKRSNDLKPFTRLFSMNPQRYALFENPSARLIVLFNRSVGTRTLYIGGEVPPLVAEKKLYIWVIDERRIQLITWEKVIQEARDLASGLKNPFVVLVTPTNSVDELFHTLLS